MSTASPHAGSTPCPRLPRAALAAAVAFCVITTLTMVIRARTGFDDAAKDAGMRVMDVLAQDLRPRDLIRWLTAALAAARRPG